MRKWFKSKWSKRLAALMLVFWLGWYIGNHNRRKYRIEEV